MQSDFLAKVHTMYNQFTKAEKKVADFILQNPKRVLFMSITELADECKVGDTSVFHFCRTMGVKGYQEFKMQLSLSIHDGKEEESRLAGETSLEDSFSELAKKVLNTNMKALAETYSLLDEKVVSQTVDILHAAERIWFFGVGASLLVALKAANKFLRIEPKAYCVQDTHTQAMIAATMRPGEAAVVFSYSGATKDSIHVAELAKHAGAKVICITHFAKSPLTVFADLVLLCGSEEGPLQGGSASAEIGQLFLVDLLCTEYYRRYYDACSKNNEKTSQSVLDKLY